MGMQNTINPVKDPIIYDLRERYRYIERERGRGQSHKLQREASAEEKGVVSNLMRRNGSQN